MVINWDKLILINNQDWFSSKGIHQWTHINQSRVNHFIKWIKLIINKKILNLIIVQNRENNLNRR